MRMGGYATHAWHAFDLAETVRDTMDSDDTVNERVCLVLGHILRPEPDVCMGSDFTNSFLH